MSPTKYVVILAGNSENTAVGPFDSKAAAIQRATDIVVGLGIDTYSTREMVEQGIRDNGRNDVSIGRLVPTSAKIGLGAV